MSLPAAARDERTLARTATACAALVFVVVASSAWLRLAATPCPPGGCDAFTLADAVRLAHRLAAMGVTVLALVIAALAWKAPARPGRRAAAVALLLLVAALAVIGLRSRGAAPPAVMLANLVGGLALLAFSVGLATSARAPRGRVALSHSAAAVLFALAVATGGVLATAAPADPSPLALVHRALSWASLAAWALLAARAGPAPGVRLAARLATAFMAAQVLLATTVPGAPLANWLHNLLTTAALCACVAATFASRSRAPQATGLPGHSHAGP